MGEKGVGARPSSKLTPSTSDAMSVNVGLVTLATGVALGSVDVLMPKLSFEVTSGSVGAALPFVNGTASKVAPKASPPENLKE